MQILVGLPNGEGLTAIRSLKELDDIQFIIGGRIIEIAGGICHKTESTAIEDREIETNLLWGLGIHWLGDGNSVFHFSWATACD